MAKKKLNEAQFRGLVRRIIKDIMIQEETEHQEKFRALLKKFGVKSIGELSDEDKKKFFNAVDAGTRTEKEKGGQED